MSTWILALIGLFGLEHAHAQVEIQWAGPTECDGSREVEAEIARLLPGAEEHRPLVARVRARRDGNEGVWTAEVRLTEGDSELGERTFEATSCNELRGAVALLVVLAVDPDAMVALETNEGDGDGGADDAESATAPGDQEPPAEEGPTNGENEAPSEEAADQLTPPVQTDSQRADRSSRVEAIVEPAHWGIEARVGVEFASLPSASPLFSLGAFHQRKRFAIGLSALVALPQSAPTAVPASGRLAYGAVRATPGLRLRLSRLVFDVRSVVELGVMGGRGQDVAGPQTGYSLWAALGAELGVSLRVGPISLGFFGDLRFPLHRPLYAFRGPLDVHRSGSVVGRAEFSLQLHFR